MGTVTATSISTSTSTSTTSRHTGIHTVCAVASVFSGTGPVVEGQLGSTAVADDDDNIIVVVVVVVAVVVDDVNTLLHVHLLFAVYWELGFADW